MSDRRLIAVELTDKHMDILCRSIDIKKEYLDAEVSYYKGRSLGHEIDIEIVEKGGIE